MSSKNNVNPDHYKVAGRERQGEDVVHSVQKQMFAETESRAKRGKHDGPNQAPEPQAEGTTDTRNRTMPDKGDSTPAADRPKNERSHLRERKAVGRAKR